MAWMIVVETIPEPTKVYVPKSQRSQSSKMTQMMCAWAKSWLKTAFNSIEDQVYSWKSTRLKTKHKSECSLYCHTGTTAKHRKAKGKVKVNIVRLVCVLQDEIRKDNNNGPRGVSFDTDTYEIKVDNCSSRCMSPEPDDFVGDLKEVRVHVKGLGMDEICEVHEGTLKWSWQDDDGISHTFYIPNSLYVPQAPDRILSPQHFAQGQRDFYPDKHGTWCGTYHDEITLWWKQKRYKRTIKLDRATNVGNIHSAPGFSKFLSFCTAIDEQFFEPDIDMPEIVVLDSGIVSDDESYDESEYDEQDDTYESEPEDESSRVDPEIILGYPETPIHSAPSTTIDYQPWTTSFDLNGPNKNAKTPAIIENEEDLAPQDAKAEMLKWHHRLGHASFKKIRWLARQGILPKYLATCKPPMCSSCLYGKATRRPSRTKSQPLGVASLRTIDKPGQCVSIDMLESITPGFIAQLRGKPTKQRYRAATIFVDHYSRLGFVYLHKSTTAAEAVEAKKAFERWAASHGIIIRHYHADNGAFAAKLFRDAVANEGQTMSFCGVNAHFQNALAERRIRELQETARTMLVHAHRRWPSAISTYLWPYALRSANDLFNVLPSIKDGISPLEKFSGSKTKMNPNHYAHFGCPAYVLASELQQGKSFNKWDPRARLGVYLGQSPQHARTVSLVLSLRTGLVSPQYNLSLDPTFQTLRKHYNEQVPISNWQFACGFVDKDGKEIEQIQRGDKSEVDDTAQRAFVLGPSKEEQARDENQAMAPLSILNEEEFPQASEGGDDTDKSIQQEVSEPEGVERLEPEGGQQSEEIEQPPTEQSEPQEQGQRQSSRGRTIKAPERLVEVMINEMAPASWNRVPYEVMVEPSNEPPPAIDEELVSYANTARKTGKNNNPDVMYLHNALKQPDRKQFIEAMRKEVSMQSKSGNWNIVHRSKVPRNASILPAVWAMRRKRRIATGEIYKWKARLNIDGSKQKEGVDYWQTFAPVISWPVARLILIMVILAGWYTRQIDYVLAYTQADVEMDNLYMELPKGFEVTGGQPEEYVLHIRKNIYGQKQAGRVWYQHLSQKLVEDVGFKKSGVDDCVFYKGNVIYILYTDDSIIAGPSQREIDEVIQQMKDAKLDLTVEGDVGDFLGVKIERLKDGSIKLTQPQLIDSILKDLRLDSPNVRTKVTPAKTSSILKRHEDGDPHDGHFNYRSVVGKMGYLEQSTRPDLAYSLHQCQRFAANPKKQHAEAVKWIGKYLAGTRDKGLILRPHDSYSFDCYVDADWAGNWDPTGKPEDDRDTARSRSGYVVFYAGCPIVWASKLQTTIALSSTEAELYALSTALRTVIPLMRIVRELKRHGFPFKVTTPTVHCRVFEDNSGAIEIATVPKMRPRTKFINLSVHHFRSFVESGDVIIKKISTEWQLADILTKSPPYDVLKFLRPKIMGW